MKIPLHNIFFFAFKGNEIILPCKKKSKMTKKSLDLSFKKITFKNI
jgi:hypothetical protein